MFLKARNGMERDAKRYAIRRAKQPLRPRISSIFSALFGGLNISDMVTNCIRDDVNDLKMSETEVFEALWGRMRAQYILRSRYS